VYAYIFLRLPANESEQMAVALLTKKDLAERIGCCERTVRNLLARNDGPAVTRVGGLVRVQESDFEAFLARCRKASSAVQPSPERAGPHTGINSEGLAQ
jgi:excisionase family DNA binding protein